MTAFLVLLLAYTLSQFYRAFLAIVAGDLSRDLGLDAANLGSLSAIWFAAFALAQFPVGALLDRVGPRRTIAGLMLLAVAGAAWLAAAESFPEALAAMALIGVGCSPVLMGGLYLFARNEPPRRFAMLSSLFIGLGSAGNLLGATPLVLAVEAVGWRGAIAGIAGVTLLSAALALLVLRDPARVDAPAGSGRAGLLGGALGGFGEVLRLKALWPLLPLTAVSYAVVIAVRSLWIAPFFGEVHGFDASARGNAALGMAAAMTAGALAYGPLERWIGDPKRTVLLGSLATGLFFVALGLVGNRSAGLAILLFAGVGAAGMTYGILMAHARLFMPAHLLGRGVTFMNFGFIAGAGLLQQASGAFVQAGRDAGAPAASTFDALHLAFGAAVLAATLVYAFAPARPRTA